MNKKILFFALLLSLPLFCTAQEVPMQGLYQDAQKHLVALLNIDTSQPEPDETAAVRYLYKELNKHGIDWDFLSPHKGRANLLARIQGSDPQAKPLLLISHLDTAPAGENWSVPPYKATLLDGKIYGLGATDAKNYTAAHLAILTHIKAQGLTPKRDIIFLATSGEESGSDTGIKWLAETQWEKINPGYALNEGGGIIKDTPGGQPLIFAEAGSKMYMDIKITATGEAAHSSLPLEENAVYRLSQALAKVQNFNPAARLTDTALEFFRKIAPFQEEDAQTTLQLLLLGKDEEKQMAAEIIAKDPFFCTQLKDTLNPVNISSGTDTGASAAEASAVLNVRLLPGTDPDEFFEELKTFLGEEEHLTLEILERPQLPFPAPMNGEDELFASIERTAQRIWSQSVSVAGLNPASGDGEFLRRLGVITYGIGPVMNPQENTPSPHTADEFISLEDFEEQVAFMAAVVYDFALDKNIVPPAVTATEQTTQTEEKNEPANQTIVP